MAVRRHGADLPPDRGRTVEEAGRIVAAHAVPANARRQLARSIHAMTRIAKGSDDR